ncbi:RNA polymerase sigma factor [Paenibacillus spongiae]|uniref:RNA polymerase sigma factor n=1 Tax=Paenibacillus spongiae TaxID=2909671 RepID=UPI0035A25DC9
MQSDEELIRELRQGNQIAMEILVKRHYKSVFAYLYRYSGDYHTSYDLTQETFIKMVRHIDNLSQEESFKHWLLKIALNTCRDYYRSRSYKARQLSNEWTEETADSSYHQVDIIDSRIESDSVKSAVMELPDYQRETIILRFYQDLKIKDIADLTSVGEPTVKSRINQGLSKLKAIMERGVNHDKKKNAR